MREVNDEFPNIYNSNAMRLQDITLESVTDDAVLKNEKFLEYAEFSINYILNNLTEYGDEPKLRKPEYIHHKDRSYLSLQFSGKSEIKYQAILQRVERKQKVELASYFLKRNQSGAILEIHRVKDDQFASTEDSVDPRGTELYEEVVDIIEDINFLKEDNG